MKNGLIILNLSPSLDIWTILWKFCLILILRKGHKGNDYDKGKGAWFFNHEDKPDNVISNDIIF